MKIRHHAGRGGDKIELQMTPMIDIVFQLLIFFIMTFKIVDVEGDFSIKMPEAAQESSAVDEDQIPPMKLRMEANEAGELFAMKLAEQDFGRGYTTSDDRADAFLKLRSYVVRFMGNQVGPGGSNPEAVEVQIDADFNLKYEYAISAITMISGHLDEETGALITLVEKIEFAPPHADPNAG